MSKFFQKNENSIKAQLVDSLKLPRDTVMGASIVTVIGNEQIMVENYRGILEYSCESVILQTKNCRIDICGTGLTITYYTNEDMKIEGKITQIRYL